jgi:hypothetical protein
VRSWKVDLGKLANETGLSITVAPHPPGTSKWNVEPYRAPCRAALEMLFDTTVFVLDAPAFNRFKALLGAPPKGNPRLGEMMRKRAPWDHDPRGALGARTVS